MTSTPEETPEAPSTPPPQPAQPALVSDDASTDGNVMYKYRDFSNVPEEELEQDPVPSHNAPPPTSSSPNARGSAESSIRVQKFPVKLYAILAQKEFQDIITWMPHGRSWKVLKPNLFESLVMPLFFEYSNYHSFNRLVNAWSFRRISTGPDRGSYYHELFLRGKPQLQKYMRRLPKTHKKLPMKKDDEPDFYTMDRENPLPPLEEVPLPNGAVMNQMGSPMRGQQAAASAAGGMAPQQMMSSNPAAAAVAAGAGGLPSPDRDPLLGLSPSRQNAGMADRMAMANPMMNGMMGNPMMNGMAMNGMGMNGMGMNGMGMMQLHPDQQFSSAAMMMNGGNMGMPNSSMMMNGNIMGMPNSSAMMMNGNIMGMPNSSAMMMNGGMNGFGGLRPRPGQGMGMGMGAEFGAGAFGAQPSQLDQYQQLRQMKQMQLLERERQMGGGGAMMGLGAGGGGGGDPISRMQAAENAAMGLRMRQSC